MTNSWRACLGAGLLLVAGSRGVGPLAAAEHGVGATGAGPHVFPASAEGEQAIRRFRVPPGWKVDLIAAEPDLANPVAFTFDEQERIYVVETFRLGEGVLDIRGRGGWPSEGFKKGLSEARRAGLVDETLDADLANRTVEDRERMLRMYFAENASTLEGQTDRIRRIQRGPGGTATNATVFATGFNQLVDGLASGVLARGGDVWFANVPHLWRLRDLDGDGTSDERTSLSSGYGVRVGFLGHDLHGLAVGLDGRLYFTVGDRGASVTTAEGARLETPDSGAVFRCEFDGSNLEIFATGLRNPQELVFDALGNLWTGDNNSDGGDQARWTYLVEGGDCGWHIGWQFIESPNARGPWNSERMWVPEAAAAIGYVVPPLLNIGAGPSGITYNYGTGFPSDLDECFFMTDFRGGPSGIWSFRVRPKGAGYEVADLKELLWNALPTDAEVGPDGGLYWTDWVQGWSKPGKGRIYRMYDPVALAHPIVADTRQLLSGNWASWDRKRLGGLLEHPDLRVRREAQFLLAKMGAVDVLAAAARKAVQRHGRLHGLWGLGQIGRKRPSVLGEVIKLLGDPDAEVRAQSAKVLGDARHVGSGRALEKLLSDPEPRPRFFAALALGRFGRTQAGPGIVGMLRTNANVDPYLRHAGVMGLVGTHTPAQLAALSAEKSPGVRIAAVVALRRLRSPLLAGFLGDGDPTVVLEAARAIHDLPVADSMADLAALIRHEGEAEPLLRRALNANLRVGTPTNALALADFAAREGAPEGLRAEALRHLAQWARPSGRDQVTGLWRPVPAREPGPAREALAGLFAAFLASPALVQVDAIRAAGRLEARELADTLRALARDGKAGETARVAALRVLGDWREPGLEGLLNDLVADAMERVRSEVLRLQTRLGIGDPLVPIRVALRQGSIPERQVALASLGAVPAMAADALLVEWLGQASRRKAPPEVELELLEAARGRAGAAVKEALKAFEASLAGTNVVAARRYLLRGGDAAAGRRIFLEKESVQCLRCHKTDGVGGLVGPDLAGIGARQTREYILQAILEPNAAVAAGFENVMVETKSGGEFAGTLQSETDTELVLNTVDQGPVSLRKAEIADRRKGLSSMPEGLGELITPRELRDLVEFLAGSK